MNKLIIRNLVLLALVILMIGSASAVPIPLGIDGRVYELDGVTQVFPGVPVIIEDVTSGRIINTKTGLGSSGRYSVVLNEEIGDLIVVTAYNPLYNSSRNITLTGVIHDFDLLLNMSLPPYAPEIISSPSTTALEDQFYSYKIDSFDWNNDEITYELVKNPSNMLISGNTIGWIPEDSDVGNHVVKVRASDGSLSDEQEYTLTVLNTNDPPEIKSSPIVTVNSGEIYTYQLEVEDPDTGFLLYSLEGAPQNMIVSSNGLIEWDTQEIELGKYTVKVVVSDEEFEDTQEYEIEVGKSLPKKRGSPIGGGGGGAGGISKGDIKDFLFGDDKKEKKIKEDEDDDDDSVLDIIFKGSKRPRTRVRGLEKRPDSTKRLERIVYKYLAIDKITSEESGEATINFRVHNKWMKDRKVTKRDIVLARYTNEWKDLPTENKDEDEEYAYYESKTPDFSFFAITIRGEAKPELPSPTVNEIKEPFMIFGTLTDFRNSEIPKGTPIIFENLRTGEIIYTETGAPTSTGSYGIIIKGMKGDKVLMSIHGYYSGEVEIELKESKLRLDMKVSSGGGILGITGRLIGGLTGKNVGNAWAFIALVALVGGMFVLAYGYTTGMFDFTKEEEEETNIDTLVQEIEFEENLRNGGFNE